MNKGLRICILILGILLMVFGLLMIIGFFAAINIPQTGVVASIVFILFVGFGPLVGGFFLYRKFVKVPKMSRKSTERLENEILQLADKRNGSLTAVELAMDTSLTVEEAKERLDDWARRGIATIKISEGGTLIYQVNGMLSEAERKSAQGIYDYE